VPLDAEGKGFHWTLAEPAELNSILVRLRKPGSMGEHVNDAVDVMVVVLASSGQFIVAVSPPPRDGGRGPHIPKGAACSIHADFGRVGLSHRSPMAGTSGSAGVRGHDERCSIAMGWRGHAVGSDRT
jgi:hypothetical protein